MKWYAPVSIRQIALGFIGSLLAMMVLIAGFAAYQTHHVTLGLKQANHAAARSELAAAVERLLRRTENQVEKLSHWDETRQQLVLPEYYPYWRDQRVYESGMLPSRVTRTALYTASGKLLASSPQEHRFPAGLPAGVVPHESASWLVNDDGAIAMYQSYPVYSDEGRQTLLGAGLLRLDFLPALLHQADFRFVNRDSVGLALKV
ncbi:MAG: GGDEF-domain containing protein, partial [Hydrogenophilales bacterium 16-62-9]